MPKSIQIIRPKQSSSPMPPPHSYTVMQFKSIQNDDDDDICPVCESECTCKNIASTSAAAHPLKPTSPPALKIKVPPRNPLSSKQAPVKRVRPKSSKLNQTTAGSAIVDGTDYVILHRPGHFMPGGHQLGASAPSAFSLRDTSPLTPEPEVAPPPSRPPSRPKQRAAPRTKKKAAPAKPKQSASRQLKKKQSITPRSKKNKDSAWTSASARRKGKNVLHLSSDASDDDLSDENEYVTRMAMESNGTGSVQFPTFVSAISTASDNDDSTTSMNDSFDSDSSIRAEEEDLILAEEQRAKVRHELFNGEESWHMEKRKWDHLKNNNNWEIRPRKRSVGPDETGTNSESESDMEVDEEEEEEEEGDEEDDPDIRYGRGMVTGWQSSDDDELDVELFFATLTDSSGPGSDADAEDGEDSGNETENSDLSAISVTEAPVAGLLQSPFDTGCPLVVTEDWDGRLVFANGLKDGEGVLDVHFEVNAAQRQRTICESMEIDTDEEAEPVDDIDEEEDLFVSEDDGDTTDDMLNHGSTHGVAPLPYRCPTPPVHSIDPLSTFSPIVGSRRKKLLKGMLPVESPKPADILAGAGKIFWEGAEKDSSVDRSRSASLAAASPPGTSVSSQSRQPRMGSFSQISPDPKRRVIIDGTNAVLVSPFTRVRRVGRGRKMKRIIVGNDLVSYSSKRPRQSSLPGESRTALPAEPDEPEESLVQSSPELLLPTSIGLDDVLDASFLDSDGSASATETTVNAHLRNLTRWDRVPMGTFRRSRVTHLSMLSSVIPPNDGVSYGSAGGHVLRKTPGGTALWQRDQKPRPKHPPGSVTVSPIIFPVRDGEKTPIIIEFDDPPILSQSHKQKRKDKKRRTRATTNSPFTTHTPPPIVPPLNL